MLMQVYFWRILKKDSFKVYRQFRVCTGGKLVQKE